MPHSLTDGDGSGAGSVDDNFAFLLPVMMATFSVVFFSLARIKLGLTSAFSWGLAFGAGAAAFSVGLLPLSPEWQGWIGDVLFFVSFYAYGDGLLVRFKRPRFAIARVTLIALCLLADLYLVFGMQSLEHELLLVDVSLTILLAVPVGMVIRSPRHIVDRALVTVAALVVLDTLVRIVVFNTILRNSDALGDYVASQYAFFMQVSGGALGLCFALAALGSVLLDIVSGYRDAAERDPLTSLLNRRGFEEALKRLPEARVHSGVVMTCDVDHFKQINDTFGHAAGDRVLEGLAQQLAEHLPDGAVSARFGGEEFTVFLPGAGLAEGKAIAQEICTRFGKTTWSHFEIARRVTISVGVAPLMSLDRTIHDAISRADRALYAAKAAGRNQIAVEGLVSLAS